MSPELIINATVSTPDGKQQKAYRITRHTPDELPNIIDSDKPEEIVRVFLDSLNMKLAAESGVNPLELLNKLTIKWYTLCATNTIFDIPAFHTPEGFEWLQDAADNWEIEMKVFGANGIQTTISKPFFCCSADLPIKFPNNGTLADALSEFPTEKREAMLKVADLFGKCSERSGSWGNWLDAFTDFDDSVPRPAGEYPIPLDLDTDTMQRIGITKANPTRTELLEACTGDPDKMELFHKLNARYVLALCIQHWARGFIGSDGLIYMIEEIQDEAA